MTNSFIFEYYRFSNFLVDSGNISAYTASRIVSKCLGSVYSPLYIYGKKGSGKTHLLHAIGHDIVARGEKNIICTTTNVFVYEYVNTSGNGLERFRRKYTQIDVLILDDLSFIAKNKKAQKELLIILNSLVSEKKQIVLGCIDIPQKIKGIISPLIDLINEGLITELPLLGDDAQYKILSDWCKKNNRNLNDDVMEVLLSVYSDCTVTLLHRTRALCAESGLTGKELDLNYAMKWIRRDLQHDDLDAHILKRRKGKRVINTVRIKQLNKK